MNKSKKLYVALAVSILLIGFSQRKIEGHYSWPYPSLKTLVITPEYLTDIGGLLVGARRMAADISYVQFLQYYAQKTSDHPHSHGHYFYPQEPIEDKNEKHYEGDGHDHDHAAHRDFTQVGRYERLLEFGQRLMRLDPFFNGPILDVAGSLAFNQKRVDESLTLLNEALEHDPFFHRYRLYISAMLYRKEDRDDKLIDNLIEAIKYPDCPHVLENILANLLRKYERYQDAAIVYVHISQTANHPGHRQEALDKLKKLIAEHPHIRL